MDIYKMELHESRKIDARCLVTRVPGGWIYFSNVGLVYVPFNNEFQDQPQPPKGDA